MKNIFTKILCCMIGLIVCLSGINVFALEPTMNMDWYGDYSDNTNPKLVVEFTTPVVYNQRIMLTVYSADKTNPTSSDYVRVKEIATSHGNLERVSINITNVFNAADGGYKIELNGNGYLRDESAETITAYVVKPADIPGIINELKNATTTDAFGAAFNKVILALQLEAEENPERLTKRIAIMIDIQSDDFGGSFNNLNEVRNAWILSDVIAYITDAGANANGLKNKIEFNTSRTSNSALIGIDTTDADYIANIDAACENVLAYNAEYDNNSGVKSIGDIRGVLNQHIGIKSINAADRDTVYTKFEKYKQYFEMPIATLEKYNGFSVSDRDKVMRWMYQKNFVKNSDVAQAFVNGVKEVDESIEVLPPQEVVPPQQGDGGGLGSTFAGTDISQTIVPTETQTTTFKDIPTSHWAYEYISKLSQKGTISGYDDGTFRPDKKVTREEFVKMIIGATGLLGEDNRCEFSDVPVNSWFYSYVASGYSKGIIGGMSDTTFGVGRNITRQDVAVIAARIIQRLSDKTMQTGDVTLTDIENVSDYAVNEVKLLNGMGIINGFDDGSYRPHDALTRAEAATIISKLTERL